MNGDEFKRRVKKLARANNVYYQETRQGKGSHSRVYYGDRFTTVKRGEIGSGLLGAMCAQLGIAKEDLLG